MIKIVKSFLFSLLGCIGFALFSCSYNNAIDEENLQKSELNSIVVDNINESAMDIKDSLSTLNNVEKARYGNFPVPLNKVNDPFLEKTTLSISWYGPVDQLLHRIAETIGYKVQIFGKEPSFPVIINLSRGDKNLNASVIDVLRDIDIQSKVYADIYVQPSDKVISLRYSS